MPRFDWNRVVVLAPEHNIVDALLCAAILRRAPETTFEFLSITDGRTWTESVERLHPGSRVILMDLSSTALFAPISGNVPNLIRAIAERGHDLIGVLDGHPAKWDAHFRRAAFDANSLRIRPGFPKPNKTAATRGFFEAVYQPLLCKPNRFQRVASLLGRRPDNVTLRLLRTAALTAAGFDSATGKTLLQVAFPGLMPFDPVLWQTCITRMSKGEPPVGDDILRTMDRRRSRRTARIREVIEALQDLGNGVFQLHPVPFSEPLGSDFWFNVVEDLRHSRPDIAVLVSSWEDICNVTVMSKGVDLVRALDRYGPEHRHEIFEDAQCHLGPEVAHLLPKDLDRVIGAIQTEIQRNDTP